MLELKLTCDKCHSEKTYNDMELSDTDWIPSNGKHYCSQKCKDEAETPKVSKAAIGLAHSLMYCLSVDNVNFLTKGIEELLLKQREACKKAYVVMPSDSSLENTVEAILNAQIEE